MAKRSKNNAVGKNRTKTWNDLVNRAVEVSGEDAVLSQVSKKCGTFNDVSSLIKFFENDLCGEDRNTQGWLKNSLNKLGKEEKVNKYASASKNYKPKENFSELLTHFEVE
ncbi:MAG: hypothetical protein COA45_09910 [Zetaproteobacteria bacterium]|nr:MAG: hypothetical protein COA45_09910 [Zetaproteobacteria bacterium]